MLNLPSFSQNPSAPVVSVVIVSYNTRELTLRCLRELTEDLEKSGLSFEICAIDNASRDQSAEAIARAFPAVQLIASPQNLGFGAANNRGFEKTTGEFLFLLNSDAFVKPGAVRKLVEFLRERGDVGAVGPRLLNADGSLQASCWKFPSPARCWIEAVGIARFLSSHPQLGDYYRWAHDDTREVDFVIGAALMVRRAVYEQVGGFDENFFLYAEETDWQKRMTRAGWKVVFTPDAVVTHLGGASGANEKSKVSKLFWEGQERYILKHHGRAGWVWMRAGILVGAMARAAGFTILALRPRHRALFVPKLQFSLAQAWRLLSTRPPGK